MGILDEAIREHLELKRQHGADEPELKKLEDEALGPPGGPGEVEEPPEMSDAEAEAPTDYIGSPAAAPPAREEDGEAATSEEAVAQQETAVDPRPPEMRPEQPPPAVEEVEPDEPPEVAEEAAPEPAPAQEEHPAMEHEVPEPPTGETAAETSAEPPEPPPVEAGGVSAELRAEREEIAQHPTEHYDVEEEIAESEKEAAGFFNEQSLSDELDQALDSPDSAPPAEEPPAAEPADEVEVEVIEEPEEGGEVEPEAIEPEEGGEEVEAIEEEPGPPDEEGESADGEDADGEEDVLEETPEFLQDSPEHDRLWFEQKPPKDFDFDD